MPKNIVRYGLMSTAQIGLNAHLQASRESKNSEIVSVSSRDPQKAEIAAQEHSIERWYGSYEEQLEDTNMDAVVNALPNSMHCEWTIKAAEAGKHILCEKPLAVTAEDCRLMIDAAKSNNVLLVEGFTHRWNPHLRKARELIINGELGKISTIDASLCQIIRDPKGKISFSKELAGGSMWWMGCYAVYAARFVMSEEPIRVHGVSYDSGNWGVDTTFSGTMEFPSGTIANVSSSYEQPYRCQISIDGSEGRIEIPGMFDDSGPIIIKKGDARNSRDEKIISTPAPYRFVVQFDEFSECVLTGKKPEFPAEDGLINTTIIEAMYKSAESSQSVNIEL